MDLGRKRTTLGGSMAFWEARSTPLFTFITVLLVACGPPGPVSGPGRTNDRVLELSGINTNDLTTREKHVWSQAVQTLMAPCPTTPTTVVECIEQKRDCMACIPAARLVAAQVQKGKTANQVEEAYRARFAPDAVVELELGNSPSLGKAEAPIVLVEWADFECAFCGKASALIHSLLKKYPDQVRLVFKHYPLGSHPHADFAARASVAAHQQGKFWEFHERLFANQTVGLDETRIRQLAQSCGLDMPSFEAALLTEEAKATVAADRDQASRLGLKGTPMLYINGRYFDSTYFDITQDLEDWITLELEATSAASTTAGSTP